MLQFPDDEFDHDGVVEKAESRDVIRNQIFRLRKVGEGVENPRGRRAIRYPSLKTPVRSRGL